MERSVPESRGSSRAPADTSSVVWTPSSRIGRSTSSFLGMLGSPVNPGITTSRSATFMGTYVGVSSGALSFKPYIGCMPASGGGSRVPTSVSVFPPGQPVTRRAKTVRVRPGSATVTQACRRGERLVGASHAFGFFTRTPPSASLVSSVTGSRTVRGGSVRVSVRGDAELGESVRWSRCTPCARGLDELPEPLAPALAARARGCRRRLAVRRETAHAVRGPVHEHGRARDRRVRANLAPARAARALRARARACCSSGWPDPRSSGWC